MHYQSLKWTNLKAIQRRQKSLLQKQLLSTRIWKEEKSQEARHCLEESVKQGRGGSFVRKRFWTRARGSKNWRASECNSGVCHAYKQLNWFYSEQRQWGWGLFLATNCFAYLHKILHKKYLLRVCHLIWELHFHAMMLFEQNEAFCYLSFCFHKYYCFILLVNYTFQILRFYLRLNASDALHKQQC